ncbi:MAG TPA: hypothetical protein PKJ47_13815, partial [Candidatus Limiplasma sp.]|nr:hypothetical protein [Candidatus Limiplasma sp.]
DSGEFDKGIDDATQKGESSSGKLQKSFGLLKGAIVAAVSIATVKKIGDAFVAMGEKADAIDESSQKLGLSKKAYQEWAYVLSQNGGNIESFGVGMKTLQNAMAQGTKATEEAFTKLGLSSSELKKMTPEDALAATIKAFQEMPASAEKTALAMDLFGKQGMELMPTLNQTAESTEALKKRAHDLGLVLSDEAVEAGGKFADNMETLKLGLAAVGTNIIAKLMPSLSKFIEKILPLADKFLPKLTEALGSIFESVWPLVEDGLNLLADAMVWVADNIEWLIPVVGALSAALLVLNIVMNANPISLIIIGIAALVAGIVLLVQNFDAVKAWLDGIGAWIYTNVIAPVGQFFSDLWTSVSQFASDTWDSIVETWTAASTWFNDNVIVPVKDFFATLWGSISSSASTAWDDIVLVWEAVSTWFNDNIITPISTAFTTFWTGISSAASTAWNAIVLVWEAAATWFDENITQKIQKLFTDMWSAVSSAASDVWTNITGWINDIISLANTAITTIKSMLGLKGWSSSDAQSAFESSSGGQTWEQVVAATEGGYATGLDYVPNRGQYTLDPGEAVLTKLEADNWRRGDGSGFVGATAQDIAAAVASAMQNVRVLMDGKTVGTLVAATVSSVIGETTQTLRYV